MGNIEYATIIIITGLLYIFLYNNETRWKRLIGCFGIIIFSLSIVLTLDNQIGYFFFLTNLLIAGTKIFEEVTQIAT